MFLWYNFKKIYFQQKYNKSSEFQNVQQFMFLKIEQFQIFRNHVQNPINSNEKYKEKAIMQVCVFFCLSKIEINILKYNIFKIIIFKMSCFHGSASNFGARKNVKLRQTQFQIKDTGKSSSRKVRYVLYYTLYRMDPQKTY